MQFQACLNLQLSHSYVSNAYVKGLLRDLIYIKAPRELNDKLLMPLYGPKPSDSCWYETMNESIVALGSIKSRFDPCVYDKRGNERVVLLGLTVDFVLNAFHDEEELRGVTLKLEERLRITILGPV